MSGSDLLNAFIPLLIIFGLLYGILYFVKKFSFSAKSKVSKSFSVNLISNQMILPKKYISVVRVKDKILVLGVSETSINLLQELQYDKDLEEDNNNNEVKGNFLEILKRNLTSR
jgi:flagellar protein FliO/FliZ